MNPVYLVIYGFNVIGKDSVSVRTDLEFKIRILTKTRIIVQNLPLEPKYKIGALTS